MSISEIGDLLLAELAGEDGESDGATGRSLSALVDALGPSNQHLSSQIEFATALDELRSRDLVATADGNGADETTFELTPAGRERATAIRDRLRSASITVVDDDSRTVSLSEAADALDRSPVEIAAELTTDGVYYRDDAPPSGVVVGRDDERERCRNVVEAVRTDRSGRALFLTGPGGVGKTTLAEAVLEDAEADGLEVLRAQCREAGDPFAPIRELLAHLESAPSPFETGDAAVEDPDAFEARRAGLFHDVTAALAPDADGPPRLCFVDDLHLADPATMAYVGYLLERLDEYPLVVLSAFRATAIPDDAPVADGAFETPVERVELGPLDGEGTRGVLEQVVGHRGAPDALVDAVHERTGGNPLFVEETVSRLLETDQLDSRYEWYPDEADAIDVPEAVTDTIDSRIADLDADARHLLRWAAVVGVRSPLAVLETVCNLPSRRVSTLLEALVSADVFDWVDERAAVTFRTEVVRDAILADVDEERRRGFHADVARALEDLDAEATSDADRDGGTETETATSAKRDADADGVVESPREAGTSDRARAIGSHYERAGEPARAIEWYREAGERATAVYAHEAAIERYRSALALARDGDDETTLLSVAERLAEIYATTGEFDDAERYVTFARERAEEIPRRQRLAALSARIANARGEYETAIELTADGLALDDGPSQVRCRLLNRQAKARRELGDLEGSEEAATRQRDEASALGDAQAEGRALRQLGSVARSRGEHETARERLEKALEAFRPAEDRLDVAKVHHVLGNVSRPRGELESATDHYRRALEAYEAVGARRLSAMVEKNLGVVAGDRGEIERAGEHFADALEAFETIGDRHSAAIARLNLGVVPASRGEYETARREYRRALETFEDIGDRHNGAICRLNLGETAFKLGEFDRAREHQEAAREVFEAVGDRFLAAKSRTNLGKYAVERGALERGETHLEGALEEAEAIDDDRSVAEARLELGRLATERDEYAVADERLRAALETFEEIGEHEFVAKSRLALGDLDGERGAYEDAADHLNAALGGFREMESRHDAARARLALGRVTLECGETETAREHLQNALDTFEELGVRDDEITAARRALARVDAVE